MRRSRKPFVKNNNECRNVPLPMPPSPTVNGHALKICYTDIRGQSASTIVSFKDTYEKNLTAKDNFERAVFEIVNNGAFWLNDTCIIPSNRISQFIYLPPQRQVQNPKPEQKVEDKVEPKKIDFGDNLSNNNLSDNKGDVQC